ncbi:MAG: DUF3284 domain-containing protein [Clostridium sp.]|uniref:DUF3284 domain-containing protein n=1 Tax=Clostridium sp. TaxID=1506 RepID=UPI001EB24069|nr:DUF3284 domain-containing protein [Clostridium sp.]MBS5885648.1 DUF3284 domain-containing protein [Clostridium sp.]MDU7149578.1 DUF3284 domain-containing protein [Clostridium sp.]MDU7242884.1 DUF3284 domain-containing protein [Clostridium sp.]
MYMLKTNEILHVDSESFFNNLVDNIAYDVFNATGENIPLSSIKKGFNYKKNLNNKLGRKGTVNVEIIEFNKPISYSAKFQSSSGVNTLSYYIEALDKNSINVTYIEDFKGSKGSMDLNYKLLNIFFKRNAKKRIIHFLHSMEESIIDNKNSLSS